MWERTLNNFDWLFGKFIWLLLGYLIWAGSVMAFPRYTTRENAIHLAEVIDKGKFKSHQIASVFVKNRTSEEYYLQVILDDGSSQDWYLDNIYDWTLTDQLLLTNNRVLIFPSNESTEFHLLDKNQFYHLVLIAKSFTKNYPQHDLLAGKNLRFAIRRFRLIQPDEDSRFKTDSMGNRYRYILEFKNGSREVLTYLSAYKLMQEGAFDQTTTPDNVVLDRAFQVKGINVIPKQLEDELRNIWRFGVEVLFESGIPLTNDLFPFQIVEEMMRDPETGERVNRFFIQILFPNTEKFLEIPMIRTLEYLQYINVVTDIENQKRVFLRAQITPEVFELPPYIEVTTHNSVIVHFFIITDQSVSQRQQFVEPHKVEAGIHPALIPISRGTEYEKTYLKAVEMIRSVQGNTELQLKITTYMNALEELQNASLAANNDAEIAQSLAQRDVIYEVLPQMIIENTKTRIKKPKDQINKDELRLQLQKAEQMVDNREMLEEIWTLLEMVR